MKTFQTPDSQEEIKADFQKRQKRQKLIALAAILIFIIPLLLLKYLKASAFIAQLPIDILDYTPFFFGGGILALAALSFWNWRCPACEKYLGKTNNPKFCPSCGVVFSE